MKVAALLCLATACAAQTAGTGSTGSISGVVRDAGTGAPVAAAVVSLRMPNGGAVASAADAQGQYILNGLAAGTYRVNASGPLEKGQTQTQQQEKTVRLGPGQTLTSVDFRLPSIGAIYGRVLDENEQPVSGAQVMLVGKRYDHGALRYPLAGARAQTDEAGAYRLTGVPAGEAFLVETQAPRTTAPGDSPADTFYPQALSAELAAEIVLSPGETRNGVDIHRAKLPAYCVDGGVEGAPGGGLDLAVHDAVVLDTHDEAYHKTKPDGTFRVCGLHRGQYLFLGNGGSPGAGQPPFLAAGTVDVTDDDVHDFKLLPASMFSISAEFVWDGDPSAQLPSLNGALTLQGRIQRLNLGLAIPGSFTRSVMLQPDDYTIDVRGISGGGSYLKEITCGGRSVLHGVAPLGGAASCGALRFVIAHDGGTLTARVADKDSNPISDAYVAIVPESAATEAEMSAVMSFGQTGQNGVYSASALAPGKYRVLATNETIDLAANRVDKLWAAQSRGQEVEIGANASVQVKLEPQTLQ
ncbi:MAG: carboxypeptidase-like regulatory domain-containing protein [Bryobacteraceae bacterium]